jgi:hypothetical protein
MESAAGRRLRPVAILCALLFVLWGIASAVSLVVQIMNLNEFGWPDEDAPGEVWAFTLLFLGAAAVGFFAAVWGVFGLRWRPPLHLAAVPLVLSVLLELAANLVLVRYFDDLGARIGLGDQLEQYVDRITFDTVGVVDETKAFLTAVPLMSAALVLLVYLLALFTGAGRRKRAEPPAYAAPYPPAPQPGAPAHPQAPPAAPSATPSATPPPTRPTTPPAAPPSSPTVRRPPDPPGQGTRPRP